MLRRDCENAGRNRENPETTKNTTKRCPSDAHHDDFIQLDDEVPSATSLCDREGLQSFNSWSLCLRGHGDLRRMATCDCDLHINVQLVLPASNQERRTPVYLTTAPELCSGKCVVRLLGRKPVQGLSAPRPMCGTPSSIPSFSTVNDS